MGLWRERFIWSVALLMLYCCWDWAGTEPLGDWVPLRGDWREEGEVAHPGFLKLFAETFKRLNLPAVQCSCVR